MTEAKNSGTVILGQAISDEKKVEFTAPINPIKSLPVIRRPEGPAFIERKVITEVKTESRFDKGVDRSNEMPVETGKKV